MAAAAVLKNIKNSSIFATDWPTLMKLCTMMHLGPKILRFRKSKMAAAAILKNRNIAISPQRIGQFWRNLAQWCKTVSRCDDLGGLGEYPVYHCSCFSSFFFGFLVKCTGRTSGPISTICTSYDVFSQKNVPFGGCVDTASHLECEVAQKPDWGRE